MKTDDEKTQKNRLTMSTEKSQEDKQFDQFKASFFKCVTDVFQLIVEKLHTIEIKEMEKEMAEVWGSSVVARWFMDIQRPIMQEEKLHKMNIATCYTILQYACNLEPPDSEEWTETGICGNSLEYLITAMLCQLIAVAYSKDYLDDIQQNQLWDKLIETLNELYGIVVDNYPDTDFESDLSKLLQCWSVREKKDETIDLSENTKALDFIVRREILEEFKTFASSVYYFCPNKLFSKFKISHLNTDQLIKYSDVFDWKDTDDQFPQIYVICGERAVGKSLYMKYVYQQFGSDSSSFIGIDKFDLVIFIDSSNNSAHCLFEHSHSYFQNTAQKLKINTIGIQEIMMRGKLLVMMDSFDVATPETHQLLNELTTFCTNDITLMIATRSDSLDNLCEKLPTIKKTLLLFPDKNRSIVDSKDQGQRVGNDGVTANSTVFLEIPPGYETSSTSKSKFIDVNQLTRDLEQCEMVTINDENPRDKKKPSTKVIKNVASKLNILIERLHTATAQLSNYESEEGRCQLQEILDKYKELHKEADALNKKLPSGMRTSLYTSGESIFCGITYWLQNQCGEPGMSSEMLDVMEDNYSTVKKHLYPKPELNLDGHREKPNYELVMANLGTLNDLISQSKEAVLKIENNEGKTDQETKIMLRELVIDIRNLRERCDSFNESIPKIDRFNYHLCKKHLGLFAGFDYFLNKFSKQFSTKYTEKGCSVPEGLIQQLDEADEKVRNHLLNPEPIKPKLVKSWKSEVSSSSEKKKKWKKTKAKKKCKTGW